MNEFENGLFAQTKPDPTTRHMIRFMIAACRIPNAVEPQDLHCTLQYSRTAPKNGVPSDDTCKFSARPSGFEVWPTQTGKRALVMRLDCPELVKYHHDMKNRYELSYDYPEYKPHMTLSYDVPENFDLNKIRLPIIFVDLENVYLSPLNLNYLQDKEKEKNES